VDVFDLFVFCRQSTPTAKKRAEFSRSHMKEEGRITDYSNNKGQTTPTAYGSKIMSTSSRISLIGLEIEGEEGEA
jgi:hypothetical protein